jgi:hypothetical protein
MFDLTSQRNGIQRGFEIPKNWDFKGGICGLFTNFGQKNKRPALCRR